MSVVKGLHNAVALDYHYEKKLVFWTENNLRVIRVAQMNDNNKTGKSSLKMEWKCFGTLKWYVYNLWRFF